MSIHRILSLFPRAWRTRYADEVRELLEAQPFTWRERVDLWRACGDAWWREAVSWGWAVTRFSLAIAIRVGVVLLAGWIGVRLVETVLPPGQEPAWLPMSDGWSASFMFAKVWTLFMVGRYIMRPYEVSRDPARRPTAYQLCLSSVWFALLLVFDGRPSGLPEVIWLGIFATMRWSPWLQLRGLDGKRTSTVLGL